MTGLAEISMTRSFGERCQSGCSTSIDRHQHSDLLALARAFRRDLFLFRYALSFGNADSFTGFPSSSNTLTITVLFHSTLPSLIDLAFTNLSRRLFSMPIVFSVPRKTELQPVADPTRTMHPASSRSGNFSRARRTIFSMPLSLESNN